MKTLKIKSLKSIIWLVFLFWFFATYTAKMTLPSFLCTIKDPIPLETVDFSDEIEGIYVSANLQNIYDYYCEETFKGVTSAREYIVNASENYYMGLRMEYRNMDAANELMNATHAYANGTCNLASLEQAQYEITGLITAMPSDSLEYYHEYLGWENLDEKSQDIFLPYYIDITENTPIGRRIITFLITFSLGLLFLIRVLTGYYQREIKKYIANSPNQEIAREKVEHFLNTTPEINGLRYDRTFICGQFKATTAFGELSQLAWVYPHTTTHKHYFITVYNTYSLILKFADGSKQTIAVKSEDIAHEHMQELSSLCPHTVFGYSENGCGNNLSVAPQPSVYLLCST